MIYTHCAGFGKRTITRLPSSAACRRLPASCRQNSLPERNGHLTNAREDFGTNLRPTHRFPASLSFTLIRGKKDHKIDATPNSGKFRFFCAALPAGLFDHRKAIH
jgi:hypothetical protein